MSRSKRPHESVGKAYSIRAVNRVCDILELVENSPSGAALLQIANETGLPKPSAFRYLVTLESRGYVQRDAATGRYRLGMAFLNFRSRQVEAVAQRAQPHLVRLRDKLRETINLGILDGNEVLYVSIAESTRGVRLAASEGDRDPLHSSALGKALAIQLTEQAVRGILSVTGMSKRTDRTITDINVFISHLGEARDRGYTLDDRENEPDGRCVAVPVVGSPILAAISLSAPAARFPSDGVEDVVRTLARAATQLAREFGQRED